MGGGHGIGIKRNDYRRRNRKEKPGSSHFYGSRNRNDRDNRTVDLDVTITIIKQSKVKALAVQAWRARPHRLMGKTLKTSLTFKCFTYVRHNLTNYDYLVKYADPKAYLKILEKVCDKIAKGYPFLAHECERRLKRVALRRSYRDVRIVKKIEKRLSEEQLDEYNAREEEKWQGILAALEQEEIAVVS